MSSNCTIFDQCTCPSKCDNYGRMQSFHEAADELDETIIEITGAK